FFSSRRRHTNCSLDWSSDVCSSDRAQSQQCRQGQWAGAAQQSGKQRKESHGQNGDAIRKKRCSQPMVCTSSMTPLLRYSMRASATWVEDTELAPVIERGSTTPEKRTYSLPRLMAICFSPATCRLPLGSTPITVVVIVPVNVLLALVSPLPEAWFDPDASVSSLALAQLSMKPGVAAIPRPTLPLRLVLVATFLAAFVRSFSTMVTISPTLRGRRSSNKG